MFDDDPDGPPAARDDPEGVEVVLLPPPLPGGGTARATAIGDDAAGAPPVTGPTDLTLRQRKVAVRDLNADLARELVRSTGWSHPQVNAELNRLAGIRKISEATLEQLERRLDDGRKWLKRSG